MTKKSKSRTQDDGDGERSARAALVCPSDAASRKSPVAGMSSPPGRSSAPDRTLAASPALQLHTTNPAPSYERRNKEGGGEKDKKDGNISMSDEGNKKSEERHGDDEAELSEKSPDFPHFVMDERIDLCAPMPLWSDEDDEFFANAWGYLQDQEYQQSLETSTDSVPKKELIVVRSCLPVMEEKSPEPKRARSLPVSVERTDSLWEKEEQIGSVSPQNQENDCGDEMKKENAQLQKEEDGSNDEDDVSSVVWTSSEDDTKIGGYSRGRISSPPKQRLFFSCDRDSDQEVLLVDSQESPEQRLLPKETTPSNEEEPKPAEVDPTPDTSFNESEDECSENKKKKLGKGAKENFESDSDSDYEPKEDTDKTYISEWPIGADDDEYSYDSKSTEREIPVVERPESHHENIELRHMKTPLDSKKSNKKPASDLTEVQILLQKQDTPATEKETVAANSRRIDAHDGGRDEARTSEREQQAVEAKERVTKELEKTIGLFSMNVQGRIRTAEPMYLSTVPSAPFSKISAVPFMPTPSRGHVDILKLQEDPSPSPQHDIKQLKIRSRLSNQLAFEKNKRQTTAVTAMEKHKEQERVEVKDVRVQSDERWRRHSLHRHGSRSHSPRRRRSFKHHDRRSPEHRYDPSPEPRHDRHSEYGHHRRQYRRHKSLREQKRRKNRTEAYKRERRRSVSYSKSPARSSRERTPEVTENYKTYVAATVEEKKTDRSHSYSKSSTRTPKPFYHDTVKKPKNVEPAGLVLISPPSSHEGKNRDRSLSYSKSPSRTPKPLESQAVEKPQFVGLTGLVPVSPSSSPDGSKRDRSYSKSPLRTPKFLGAEIVKKPNHVELSGLVPVSPPSPPEECTPEKPVYKEIDALIYLDIDVNKAGKRKKKRRDLEHENKCFCARNGRDCSDNQCLNRAMLFECTTDCVPECKNQRISKKEYAAVEAFYTGPKKGWGVMAKEHIPKGTFITEYIGEVVTVDQFKERSKKYASDPRHKHRYTFDLGKKLIDATVKGNCARFLNHSCDPNAICWKWAVPGTPRDVGRIGFFATKDILPGEEVTFDYKYCCNGEKPQRCFCGAVSCRGQIGDVAEGSDDEEEIEENKDDWEKMNRPSPEVAFKNITCILQVVSVPRQKLTTTATSLVRDLSNLEDEETDLKRRVISYLEGSTDVFQMAKRANIFDVFTTWLSSPRWDANNISLKIDVIRLVSNDDSMDKLIGWAVPFYDALEKIASMEEPDSTGKDSATKNDSMDINDSTESDEETFAHLRKAAKDLMNQTDFEEVKRNCKMTKYRIPKLTIGQRAAAGKEAAPSEPSLEEDKEKMIPSRAPWERSTRLHYSPHTQIVAPRMYVPTYRRRARYFYRAHNQAANSDVPGRFFHLNKGEEGRNLGKRKHGCEYDGHKNLRHEDVVSTRDKDFAAEQWSPKIRRLSVLPSSGCSEIPPPPGFQIFPGWYPPVSSSVPDRTSSTTTAHCSKNDTQVCPPQQFQFLSSPAQTLAEKVSFYKTLDHDTFREYKKAFLNELMAMDMSQFDKKTSIVANQDSKTVREDPKPSWPPKEWDLVFSKDPTETTRPTTSDSKFASYSPSSPIIPLEDPRRKSPLQQPLRQASKPKTVLNKKKLFCDAVHKEVWPIVQAYLKLVTNVNDSKMRWLVKKITAEMAKRERMQPGFDFKPDPACLERVGNYARLYLSRKISKEKGVSLFDDFPSNV